MSRRAVVASIVTHLLLATATPATAQRELPIGLDGPTLRLELAKPLFGVGQLREAHFATSLWDATLVLPVDGLPTFFAQVGFGVGEIAGAWSGAVANPRLGVLFGRREGLRGSAHVALPLTRELGDELASIAGRYSYFEEWDRYGNDSWALGASGTATAELDAGSFVGARAGSTLLIPTDDALDTEAFATLSVFGDAPAGRARIWLEMSVVGVLTEPELGFLDATSFFATGSVSLPNDRLAPEAYLRIPLDEDVSGIVSYVLGLRVHLGRTRPGA